MVRLRDISIKRKLTLIIVTASMVALLLVCGGFVTYDLVTYRRALGDDLSTLAALVGEQTAPALTLDFKTEAEDVLAALRSKPHVTAAALYDEDGKLFATYPRGASPDLFPAAPERAGTRFEKDHLILFRTIPLKGEVDGNPEVATIYLKSDLQQLHSRVQRYGAMVLLMMLVSLLVTFWLSSRLQRIVSRPIFQLAATAKAVCVEKEYSVRAVKHGNDELGQLIDAFNEMLGQIQQQDAALHESNVELDQRVRERTKALRAEIAERQRAESSLQEQLARISLLNQITQVVSERQDTESILHVVLRQLEDNLKLDLGCVALYDGNSQLSIDALRVRNPLLKPKLDLNEGAVLSLPLSGVHQCREGETVYLPDTLKSSALLAERLAGAGLRSAVAVALMVENKLFGILVTARLAPDAFSPGDCEFLRMLSEHVALAAHQAHLHEQLKRAYDELRQTQHTVMQQERLKALGQMASGIAHDVNNALSPIIGFSELLLRGEQGLSPAAQKHLKHIRVAGEDVAHIVARLRDFYRRREDNEPLQKVRLNTLVEQVIEMTRPRWRDIPQSNGVTIEVHKEFAEKVPDLLGIESELREALTNLVLNAVDALPTGGRITIRTRLAEGVYSGPSQVMLEVSDNGIGMNEETRKHCLEPFFSTKGKRGTGLGLSMVYGVMERHEGKIEVESEPRRGTTFRLIFPVRVQGLAPVGLEQVEELPAPLHVLCIDDEPLLRILIREMLERDGHTVVVTDGGQSGIEAFRAAREQGQPFDVVITDLGMPYLDGRQVTRLLKLQSPSTPVIMLTGWGAFMKEDGSAPAQVDCLLSKPPRTSELRRVLARVKPALPSRPTLTEPAPAMALRE